MSVHSALLNPSQEAIDYQGRSPLLLELTAAINNIRDLGAGVSYTSLNNSSIPKIIAKRTGLKIEITPHRNEDEFFATSLLALDHSNPLHREMAESRVENQSLFDPNYGLTGNDIVDVGQKTLARMSSLKGSIDLKYGIVSGVFSEIRNPLYLPEQAFDKNFFLSSDEVAAVIIHELGHLWAGYEALISSTSMNIIAATAAAALKGPRDKEPQNIMFVQKALGFLQVDDAEVLAAARKTSRKEDAYVVILHAANEARARFMNRYGSQRWTGDTYNQLSDATEFLADQFSVRHGAAVALTSALQKINVRNPKWKSSASLIGSSVVGSALLACAMVAGGPALIIPACVVLGSFLTTVGAVSLHGADQSTTIHERLGLIKRDLVQILKDHKLNPKHRSEVLNDLERIEEIRKVSKENLSFSTFLSRYLIPSGRRAMKTRDFQRGLEELTNNDMFVAAQRLRALK